MTTGAIDGRVVRDPGFLLAIRDRFRENEIRRTVISWQIADERSRFRDPLLHAYTQKIADSAYRAALDDARFRAGYRAYKRLVAEEGSHAAARIRIALYALLALLCAGGALVIGGWFR